MIDIKEIRDGELDGAKVWICDLRYNDYSKKPIRNVKPIEVLVRSNNKTNKTIYYSNSHFIGFNKKGETVESKIVAPFDTTGFRGRTGTSVNCFTTEKECIKHYKKQIKIAIKGLEVHRRNITKSVDMKIAELKELNLK